MSVRHILWLVTAGSALGVLWVISAPPAEANDHLHLADYYNTGGYGLSGSYTAVMKTWAIESTTTRYCVGPNTQRPSIYAAIADWESKFAFPFNEFTDACGASQRMDVLDNAGWHPCGPPPIAACMVVPVGKWYYDSVRLGYYMDYARIWVNVQNFTWSPNGMRALIAHELGHVYGLDEQYVHDTQRSPGSIACNYAVQSIMNSNLVTGGCTGLVGPTAFDSANAENFYVMGPTGFQHQLGAQQQYGGSGVLLTWFDSSPSESAYTLNLQYIWGNSVLTCNATTYYGGLAPSDPWIQPKQQYNGAAYRGSCPGATFYRDCVYLFSGVIYWRYLKCGSPWIWLP